MFPDPSENEVGWSVEEPQVVRDEPTMADRFSYNPTADDSPSTYRTFRGEPSYPSPTKSWGVGTYPLPYQNGRPGIHVEFQVYGADTGEPGAFTSVDFVHTNHTPIQLST